MKIASVAEVKAHFSAYLKASESGPVIITRNGKPAAAIIDIENEDDIESLLLSFSPKFRALLQTSRNSIQQTGGIPQEQFWEELDTEYTDQDVTK